MPIGRGKIGEAARQAIQEREDTNIRHVSRTERKLRRLREERELDRRQKAERKFAEQEAIRETERQRQIEAQRVQEGKAALTREAMRLIQRKAAGKSITFYFKGQYDPNLLKEYQRLLKRPELRRAVESGVARRQRQQIAEGKIKATPEQLRELGVFVVKGKPVLTPTQVAIKEARAEFYTAQIEKSIIEEQKKREVRKAPLPEPVWWKRTTLTEQEKGFFKKGVEGTKYGFGVVSDVVGAMTLGRFIGFGAPPTEKTPEEFAREFLELTPGKIPKEISEKGVFRSEFEKLREQRRREKEIKRIRKEQLEAIEKGVERIEGVKAPSEQEILQIRREIEAFNKQYGREVLSSTEFVKAQKELKGLEKKRLGVITRIGEREIIVKDVLGELKTEGVIAKRKDGEITFTSEAFEKTLAPGIFKLEQFMREEGTKTQKIVGQTALITAASARVGAMAFATGAGLGAVGVTPRIAGVAARLPKAGIFTLKTGVAAGVGIGIGLQGIKGYRVGEVTGAPTFGAIAGITTGTATIAGFAAGSKAGTKAFFARQEKLLTEARVGKSIFERRVGVIQEGRGAVVQEGKFVYRVKGTPIKIRTEHQLQTIFRAKGGEGKVVLRTTFEKPPPGFPKKFITKGATLETPEFIRARLITKMPKGLKGKSIFASQDVLLKRSLLATTKIKGFPRAERLKIWTEAKLGEKAILRKVPKDIFRPGEKYLFKEFTGEKQVFGPGEFKAAKPFVKSLTKQYVFMTPEGKAAIIKQVKLPPLTVSGEPIKVDLFISGARTTEMSTKLLHQVLGGKVSVSALGKLKIIPPGVKGQLFPKQVLVQPQPPKPLTITRLPSPRTAAIRITPTAPLISAQLKVIAPSLLAAEQTFIGAGLIQPTTAAALATPSLLLAPSALAETNITKVIQQTEELTKLAEIQEIAQIQTPTTKVAQIQEIAQIQVPITEITPITETALLPAVPTVTTTIPAIPLIPILPGISLKGKIRKKKGEAYITQTKRRGKWIRVSDQVFTRRGAYNFGAEVTDKSLARSFKIKKVTTKKQPREWNPYFSGTSYKFRTFRKVRKGKMPLEFQGAIEKDIYALDTPTEVNKITAARMGSRLLGRRVSKKLRRKPVKGLTFKKSTFQPVNMNKIIANIPA